LFLEPCMFKLPPPLEYMYHEHMVSASAIFQALHANSQGHQETDERNSAAKGNAIR